MSKKVIQFQAIKSVDFIDTATNKVTTFSEQVIEIPLDEINIRANVRKDSKNIEQLAESIEAQSLLQPIVVMKKDGKYYILYGHRRYHAHVYLHKKHPSKYGKIKAIVKDDIQNDDVTEVQLIENIQRENLSPIDMKNALENLRAKGYSNKEIANKICKSLVYIEQIFSSLKAINENPELSTILGGTVVNHSVGLADVKEIKALPPKLQVKLLKDKSEGKIKTQKELRNKVKKYQSKKISEYKETLNDKYLFFNIHGTVLDIRSFKYDKSKSNAKQKLNMKKAVHNMLMFIKK